MYIVKIMNEYLHGPLWVYNSDGSSVWKYALIDEDPILRELNEQAIALFGGYYKFDPRDMTSEEIDVEVSEARGSKAVTL